MDVVLTTSRGYNITLWGDCGGSRYTASTIYKYWSWSYENKVQQTTTNVFVIDGSEIDDTSELVRVEFSTRHTF